MTFPNMSSQLPTGYTISSAYIELTANTACYNGLSRPNAVFVAATPANPLNFVAADFTQFGTTALTATNTTAGRVQYDKIVFPLNAAGLTFLEAPNDGVYNVFGLRYEDDRAGTFGGTWTSGEYQSL